MWGFTNLLEVFCMNQKTFEITMTAFALLLGVSRSLSNIQDEAFLRVFGKSR